MNQETRHLNPDIYQNLFELGNSLLGEKDINKLLSMTMDVLIEISNAQRGWIMLFKESNQEIQFQTLKNLHKKDIQNQEFEISRLIIKKVKTECTLVCLPSNLIAGFFKRNVLREKYKALSVICLPLKYNENLLGILYLDYQHTTEGFTYEIFCLIQDVVHFLATAVYTLLEGKQLQNLVKNLKKATIKQKKVIV